MITKRTLVCLVLILLSHALATFVVLRMMLIRQQKHTLGRDRTHVEIREATMKSIHGFEIEYNYTDSVNQPDRDVIENPEPYPDYVPHNQSYLEIVANLESNTEPNLKYALVIESNSEIEGTIDANSEHNLELRLNHELNISDHGMAGRLEPTSKVHLNYTPVNESVPEVARDLEPNLKPDINNGTRQDDIRTTFQSVDSINRTYVDKKYRFNTLICSDSISVHRKLADIRPAACKDRRYRTDLPPVSIVITYRNEWPSVVLRTGYSVLEMSPPELIREIIFVDDGSTDPVLISKLEHHVAKVDKFKLIRNDVSLGLMKARQRGIDATTADYIIVMDGHMEVGPHWLEPLIERLLEKPNALLSSHVGQINTNDFSVGIGPYDVGFMFFDQITLSDVYIPYKQSFLSPRNHSVEPIQTGIIQGMITVMRKDFYYQLGGFDTGMEVWGFEQIELSVKTWMCGGTVEMVPCSVVVHLFRPPPWGGSNFRPSHAKNRARLALVWMDPPYQQFVLEPLKDINYTRGDISDRVLVRESNHCKPYKYFIDQVRSMSDSYIPENPKKVGLVYNKFYEKCLDFGYGNGMSLFSCHGLNNQHFILTEFSEIRTIQSRLIIAIENNGTATLGTVINTSIANVDEAMWDFLDDEIIVNRKTGLCLSAMTENDVGLANCVNSKEQKWNWGYR